MLKAPPQGSRARKNYMDMGFNIGDEYLVVSKIIVGPTGKTVDFRPLVYLTREWRENKN